MIFLHLVNLVTRTHETDETQWISFAAASRAACLVAVKGQVAKLFENVSNKHLTHFNTTHLPKELEGGVNESLACKSFFATLPTHEVSARPGHLPSQVRFWVERGAIYKEKCALWVVQCHGCIIAVVLWMQYYENTSNFIIDVAAPGLGTVLVHPGEEPPPHGRHHSCRHRRMMAGSWQIANDPGKGWELVQIYVIFLYKLSICRHLKT